MNEWLTTKLGSVLGPSGYIRGPFGSSLLRDEMLTQGIPVYEQQHAIYDHRDFRFYIDEQKHKELERFTVKEKDLIISCSGTLGKVSIIKKDDPKGIISQALLILRPEINNIDIKFLYYFLTSPVGFNSIVSVSSGSVQTNIAKRSIIENTEILLPPLPEQRAIAGVLCSLDDKIDLLHRQNKTLEGMAEALWRKMFVEEADLGRKTGKLGDVIISIETGRRPKGGIDSNLLAGVPSIGAENINGIGNYDYTKTKYVTEEYYSAMKNGGIQNYDILIYKDGAYIGKKSMFANGFPFEKCCINEHVFILRTGKVNSQLFLYFVLEQEELEQLNANSAQPGLNQEALRSFEIIIPPDGVINDFGEKAKILIDKIFTNSIQIRTLSRLRDTLLPKLMSGEVKVRI